MGNPKCWIVAGTQIFALGRPLLSSCWVLCLWDKNEGQFHDRTKKKNRGLNPSLLYPKLKKDAFAYTLIHLWFQSWWVISNLFKVYLPDQLDGHHMCLYWTISFHIKWVSITTNKFNIHKNTSYVVIKCLRYLWHYNNLLPCCKKTPWRSLSTLPWTIEKKENWHFKKEKIFLTNKVEHLFIGVDCRVI